MRRKTRGFLWADCLAVFVVSFRTGAEKYKNLEDSIFVASETVKALGGGYFRAGLKISKLYSTKTNVELD